MKLIGMSFSDSLAISFSTIVHLLFFVPSFYIVILCVRIDDSLLIWHPICFTIGCCFLMIEGILSISGEALLNSKISRAGRIRIHWILQLLGLGLMIAGLATVMVDKYTAESDTAIGTPSGHGKISRLSIVIWIIVALGGVLCMCIGSSSKKISHAILKLLHIGSGILSMMLLLVSQITGLYTSWWPGSDIGRILTVVAYAIGGILLFVIPLKNLFFKIQKPYG